MNRLQRFRDARFGLFIHWGAYSLKGIEASGPLAWGEISRDIYEALPAQFSPQRYDPAAWAALAKDAGMRYAVMTTKHHDGFSLFDTALSDYSAPKTAAGRDLIADYVEAFRAAGLLVGFYFSLCDWHHPDYPAEVRRGWVRPADAVPPDAPASIETDPARWERFRSFLFGQVRELLTIYGPIDLLWFDGDWEHTAEEWGSNELVAMIRDLQPDIVINDRLADRTLGDYATPEQHVPVSSPERPWETCLTINETWAYNPRDRAYKSASEIIATLAEVVSKGGNLLLNVGPTPEGEIPPEFASRLRVIGDWMAGNREAIFAAGDGLSPGAYYGPTTGGPDAVYLHVLGRPGDDTLIVRGIGRRVTDVTVLASGRPLEFDQHAGNLEHGLVRIRIPVSALVAHNTVVKLHLARP